MRCNLAEGRSQRPVFQLYREQHPTRMLGLLLRPRRLHPLEKEVDDALWRALHDISIAEGEDDPCLDWRARVLDSEPRAAPVWTPLMKALKRVGLTAGELRAAADERREVRDATVVCLPDPVAPGAAACGQQWGWQAPTARSRRRRPCPGCYRTDPEWMTHLVGDQYGGAREDAVDSQTPRCEICRCRPGELAAAYGTRNSAIWCSACAGPALAALTFRHIVTMSSIAELRHVRRGDVARRALPPGPAD